jgi:hypothetical protein
MAGTHWLKPRLLIYRGFQGKIATLRRGWVIVVGRPRGLRHRRDRLSARLQGTGLMPYTSTSTAALASPATSSMRAPAWCELFWQFPRDSRATGHTYCAIDHMFGGNPCMTTHTGVG